MNKATLVKTLVAAAVVGAVGVMISNSEKPRVNLDTPLVLPQLADGASALEQIKVESAGNTLVVQSHKEGERWLIDNLGNYSADTAKLAGLITALKDAKKVEPKTTKAELFHHLGLRDISDPDSKAQLVTVTAGGKEYQLLVGIAAKNGSGQYVRMAGENQSWLIDQAIDKPTAAEDWINRKLFEFSDEDIQSIHLSGQFEYVLSKADKEAQNFTLEVIPEGYKVKYDSVVNAVARSVANLSFEHLKPLAELPALSDRQTLTVKLFDSDKTIALEVAKAEDKYYAKLNGDDPLWLEWAYEISEYHYSQLAKDKMDHLEPEPEPEPAIDTP